MKLAAWSCACVLVWYAWCAWILRRPAKDWDTFHGQNLALLIATMMIAIGWLAGMIGG